MASCSEDSGEFCRSIPAEPRRVRCHPTLLDQPKAVLRWAESAHRASSIDEIVTDAMRAESRRFAGRWGVVAEVETERRATYVAGRIRAGKVALLPPGQWEARQRGRTVELRYIDPKGD